MKEKPSMNNESNINEDNLIFSPPKSMVLIGIVNILGSIGVIVLSELIPKETNFTVLFYLIIVSFSLLGGIGVIWFYKIWRIAIMENSLQLRNFFAQTKIIPFKDIEKVKLWKNAVTPKQIRTARVYSRDGKVVLAISSSYLKNGELDMLLKYLKHKSIKFE